MQSMSTPLQPTAIRLTGRTRGAPAYCSCLVSANGYYRKVPKLKWPSFNEIIKAQKMLKEKPQKQFTWGTEGTKDTKNVLWIPSEEKLPKLRILIAARTGPLGISKLASHSSSCQSTLFLEQNFTRSVIIC